MNNWFVKSMKIKIIVRSNFETEIYAKTKERSNKYYDNIWIFRYKEQLEWRKSSNHSVLTSCTNFLILENYNHHVYFQWGRNGFYLGQDWRNFFHLGEDQSQYFLNLIIVFYEKSQNLGEDQSSDSHQFRPHCVRLLKIPNKILFTLACLFPLPFVLEPKGRKYLHTYVRGLDLWF